MLVKILEMYGVLRSVFINSLYWFIGYCSMWAAKWIIASVILHQDVYGGQELKIIVYRDFCIFTFSIGCGILKAFEIRHLTLKD